MTFLRPRRREGETPKLKRNVKEEPSQVALNAMRTYLKEEELSAEIPDALEKRGWTDMAPKLFEDWKNAHKRNKPGIRRLTNSISALLNHEGINREHAPNIIKAVIEHHNQGGYANDFVELTIHATEHRKLNQNFVESLKKIGKIMRVYSKRKEQGFQTGNVQYGHHLMPIAKALIEKNGSNLADQFKQTHRILEAEMELGVKPKEAIENVVELIKQPKRKT